jgi:hypothetical protein
MASPEAHPLPFTGRGVCQVNRNGCGLPFTVIPPDTEIAGDPESNAKSEAAQKRTGRKIDERDMMEN